MRTTKLILTLIMFALNIFTMSCTEDSHLQEPKSPLYPINYENTWSYKETLFSTRYDPEVRNYDIQYNHCYTIDGYTGFTSKECQKGMPTSLLSNDENGDCMVTFFNNDKFVHRTTWRKKDLERGEEFDYKAVVYTDEDYSNYTIETWDITCITADTLITTPKGSFSCIGYLYHPEEANDAGEYSNTMVDYIADGIGVVKKLHWEYPSGEKFLIRETVLTDYSIKK